MTLAVFLIPALVLCFLCDKSAFKLADTRRIEAAITKVEINDGIFRMTDLLKANT